jgi:hypothetical protein
MQAIVSTAYFPPIQLFKLFKSEKLILIEKFENYTKQTYRNRCVILTANGPLDLIIPVVKPNGNRTLVKDVKIDNSVKWRREHWRAIESAYRSSAYFEFLSDYFEPFYNKGWNFLWDYNLEIIYRILDILEMEITIQETEVYATPTAEITDFRNAISPKQKPDLIFKSPKPYYQVFESKFGFTPNLSILDLLCNCGRESICYLD